MWDEDDHFGRWVQFLCAIPLLALGAALEYYWWQTPSYGYYGHGVYGAGGLSMLVLGIRCLWYAVTGRDNVNRDDF